MVYKIYSPRNCTSDFPTWWQWSKFIAIHTVKVSTKMEDNREVCPSACRGIRPKASARGTTGVPDQCGHGPVPLRGTVMVLLTPNSH